MQRCHLMSFLHTILCSKSLSLSAFKSAANVYSIYIYLFGSGFFATGCWAGNVETWNLIMPPAFRFGLFLLCCCCFCCCCCNDLPATSWDAGENTQQPQPLDFWSGTFPRHFPDPKTFPPPQAQNSHSKCLNAKHAWQISSPFRAPFPSTGSPRENSSSTSYNSNSKIHTTGLSNF